MLDRLDAKWRRLKQSPVLHRYRNALVLANLPPWRPKDPVYREAGAFLQLRNALVHHAPEWASGGYETHRGEDAQRFQALLQGRFPLSPFAAIGNVFFPDQCLSVGCLRWGFRASLAFMDEFFRRMGIGVPYAQVRPRGV